MSYKDFLLDKAFWILTWPVVRGSIIYAVTALVLLLILALVSQSYSLLLEALQAIGPQLIRWTIMITISFNIGVLLLSLRAMGRYLAETPLKLEGLRATVREINERNKKSGRTVPEDIAPIILFIVVITGLFNAYVLVGTNPEALQAEVTIVLPFAIGLLAAYGTRILILIGLLHLKYMIHLEYNRVLK